MEGLRGREVAEGGGDQRTARTGDQTGAGIGEESAMGLFGCNEPLWSLGYEKGVEIRSEVGLCQQEVLGECACKGKKKGADKELHTCVWKASRNTGWVQASLYLSGGT